MKTIANQYSFTAIALLMAVALFFIPSVVENSFQLRVVMLFLVYALIAMGLNILVGLAGLVSLGQAGLYALGAYTAAILATSFGWPFFATVLAAIAVTAVFGIALSYPSVRVRGVYLAVITIAFGLIVQHVAIDWRTVTGGTLGLSNVPRVDLGFGPLENEGLYALISVVAFSGFLLYRNVMYSRFGRAMRATAQSDTAARSLGINPTARRVFAFVISAVYAGIAGALYAYLNRYVNPDTFSFSNSVQFLLMVILGGSGTVLGPIVGAGVLTWIPNLFQAFGIWQLFIYGALLAAVIFILPKGIVGTINHWARYLINRSSSRHPKPETWPKPSVAAAGLLRVKSSFKGPVLRTESLTIQFGGLKAVAEANIEVERGMVHAIIGPNGAGKTTLLNALSGFYRPTSGEIYLGDKRISDHSSERIARAGVTRTFQNTELFSDMSVQENVLVAFDCRYKTGLLGTITRLPSYFHEEQQMRARAALLLDYVGLADFAEETAKNLAFGHQRRLEIARALALSPEVLLLDEPAAGLTHGEIDDLITLIRNLKEYGVTVVLVEHHVDMIMEVSDYVTVLDYGKVISSGTPDKIRKEPRVMEAYFGTFETDPENQRVIP